MKRVKFLMLSVLICLTTSMNIFAQSRQYVKEQIQVHNNCRNVAITETGGDLMLYGENGWAGSGLPKGLTDALHELNNANEYIDDVVLTENGSWIILWGNNGFRWNNIPYSLERRMREWNNENEVITSVALNDAGQWILISENYISASDEWIQDWLGDGGKKFGQLWSVCLTNDALVACYEEGYKFYGEVPQTLRNALDGESRNVFRIKIAGTSWFYADQYGSFRYYM